MPPALQTAPQTATLTAALPPGAAGQWCRISLALPSGPPWWAQLELTDESRGQIVRACFLGKLRETPYGGARATLVHIPSASTGLVLSLIGRAATGAVPRVEILDRVEAAITLLWRGRRLIAPSLRGGRHGRLGRLRAVLGQAPARAGEAPPYAVWLSLYEPGLANPPGPSGPPLQPVIAGPPGPALAATLASLAAQTIPCAPPLLIHANAGWAGIEAPWAVLLQPGEVLAPTAMAWFAHAAAANPNAAFIAADCDTLLAGGARANPLFKPGPDSVLLLGSNLPVRGACAVRWPSAPPALPVCANTARHTLALLQPENTLHIPRILTHIPAGISPAPPPAPPPQRNPGYAPGVTALVPSALRSPHVAHCLSRIVKETDYPGLSVEVIVGNPAAARAGVLKKISSLPRLRVRTIDLPNFNYAAANNKAAETAAGELLLLLNDDVAPLHPDWLNAMVAHMQDPRVGIVGARLLYGNGMVQHEGVIMGLAHLCEHAGRLRQQSDPGPHGLALLDRQVSAVTAACMLIRADLYHTLGGMDESFAIALNDVDLCLRARRAGWRIVYCAHAEMWHYESLSLGRHYAGGRAALESVEVHRLRASWGDVIAADPFYNPLASVQPGSEWQPGFPPRVAGLAAGAPNPAATGS